jgi:hypothetical protein
MGMPRLPLRLRPTCSAAARSRAVLAQAKPPLAADALLCWPQAKYLVAAYLQASRENCMAAAKALGSFADRLQPMVTLKKV